MMKRVGRGRKKSTRRRRAGKKGQMSFECLSKSLRVSLGRVLEASCGASWGYSLGVLEEIDQRRGGSELALPL